MEATEPALEWLRLSERYGRMSDEELLELSRQSLQLTDIARQVLASEMSVRRLTAPSEEEPASPPAPPASSSRYGEDRELVELSTVWSLRDALAAERLLDRAGIPFFLGPEKARRVDPGKLNFAEGVAIEVMQVGLPWARQALAHFRPLDQPARNHEEQEPVGVRCPRCRSADIIFDRLVAGAGKSAPSEDPDYAWRCDSCQHEWCDQGLPSDECP